MLRLLPVVVIYDFSKMSLHTDSDTFVARLLPLITSSAILNDGPDAFMKSGILCFQYFNEILCKEDKSLLLTFQFQFLLGIVRASGASCNRGC